MTVALEINGVKCRKIDSRNDVGKEDIEAYSGDVDNSPPPIFYFTYEDHDTAIEDHSESGTDHDGTGTGTEKRPLDDSSDSSDGDARVYDQEGAHDLTPANTEAADIVAVTPGGVTTKSIDLDGSNEYFTLADHSDFDFLKTDEFSLSVWVKTTSTSWGIILSKMGSGVSRGWYMGTNQAPETVGSLFFALISTYHASAPSSNMIYINEGTAAINDGSWHHVCITKSTSASASSVKFYIDGAADSVTVTADTLDDVTTNSDPVNIGSRGDGGGGLFDGNVTEASIWDAELSLAEVQEIYNSGAPTNLATHSAHSDLVSWWRLGDGAHRQDTAKLGEKALDYGTSDFVELSHHSQLDQDHDDEWSFSTWFKSGASGYRGLYIKREGTGGYKGNAVFLADGIVQGYVVSNWALDPAITDASIFKVGNTVLVDDNWHHLVMTYDGSGAAAGLLLYVDGALATFTVSGGRNACTATMTNTVDPKVGGDTTTTAYGIGGLMDETAFWDEVLTASQVSALYNSNSPDDIRLGL